MSLHYNDIYELALRRFGGEKRALEASLPVIKSNEELSQQGDSWYLSQMSRRVFRAGMKHSVIDQRWPYFEETLCGFDIQFCAMLGPDQIDLLMKDAKLIRHRGKLNSIPNNASYFLDIREQGQSFGEYLAQWPSHRIVELWIELKKRGSQMGGRSGASFLRMVGKDTFILSDDVVQMLMAHNIVNKAPTAQRDWRFVQRQFVEWSEQGGRPLSHVSRLLSLGYIA